MEINLRIGKNAERRLKKLAQFLEVDVTTVFRRALALYEFAHAQKEAGCEICVAKDNEIIYDVEIK